MDEDRPLARSALDLAATLALACVVLGILWDIAWDSTIGRDSFWSPPHFVSWLGGVLGGLTGLAMLARSRGRAIAGWILIWGAVAMQAASLLDDWWQAAYGFHSGGWSPPQALLTAGILALGLGTLTALAAHQDRAGKLFSVAGGLLITFLVTLDTEFNWPNLHHTGPFYEVSSLLIPIALVALSRARPSSRWSATICALIYMAIVCALIWIFPLIPAKPLLGPIYHPLEHLLPPVFPLLLIVPAAAIDLLAHRPARSAWGLALACGVAFFVLFLAVEWPFASFLLSPSADNAFFAGGGRWWPFNMQVGDAASRFWGLTKIPLTGGAIALSLLFAAASARIGWWWGAWMRELGR